MISRPRPARGGCLKHADSTKPAWSASAQPTQKASSSWSSPTAMNYGGCGYSPLYTFLAATPSVKGNVLRYEQWNIDDQSVVSFAGMEFHRTG